MSKWSPERAKLLLAFLASDGKYLDMVEGRISPNKLYENFFPEFAPIFESLGKYRETYDTLPATKETFVPVVIETLHKYPTLDESQAARSKVVAWVDALFSVKDDVKDEAKVGRKLVEQLMSDYSIKARLRELAASDMTPAQLREELSAMATQIGQIFNHKKPEKFYPMVDVEKYLNPIKITPTNFAVWDELFGGLRHSETYLILGPSGGGKTAMAVQLASCTAMRSGRVYYATYEQKAKIDADPDGETDAKRSEFSIRGMGAVYGVDRKDVDYSASKENPFGNLAPNVSAAVKRLKTDDWADRFLVVDYTSSSLETSTFSALMEDIRQEHAENPLKLVVIDPFWPMVIRTCGAMGVPIEPKSMRAQAQKMADQVNEVVKDLKLPFVLVHQLGASAAEGKVKASLYGSAEIKTIAWRFENVAVIMPQSGQDKTVPIMRAKSRNSGEMNYIVKTILRGEIGRFEPVKSARMSKMSAPHSALLNIPKGASMIDSADAIAEAVLNEEEEDAKQ